MWRKACDKNVASTYWCSCFYKKLSQNKLCIPYCKSFIGKVSMYYLLQRQPKNFKHDMTSQVGIFCCSSLNSGTLEPAKLWRQNAGQSTLSVVRSREMLYSHRVPSVGHGRHTAVYLNKTNDKWWIDTRKENIHTIFIHWDNIHSRAELIHLINLTKFLKVLILVFEKSSSIFKTFGFFL